jgi:hypothetical protein
MADPVQQGTLLDDANEAALAAAKARDDFRRIAREQQAEIERLRAALVGAEIALNRDEDVESARRIIMEANHGKQS